MVDVHLEGVIKDFDTLRAVNNVSFTINEGEILTLLGPSGCGKSTTLRMLAGFIFPTEGRIFFGEEDITDLPPQNRNTAMVFQNYALWPHLSVRKNVEYGLNIRKIPEEEKRRRVEEALGKVRLEEFMDYMPTKLSGGQQQRVAVARALVVNPDVLLLDEPLSNLDAKLRIDTRQEIRDLVKELNLTTVFVTHDQSEALSISDRIAVLERGVLKQIGTPESIWQDPDSAFVGSFIGEANDIEMNVKAIESDHVTLNVPDKEDLTLKTTFFKGIESVNETARVVIRPEQIKVVQEASENSLSGKVRIVQFFGSYTFVRVRVSKTVELNIHLDPDIPIKRGQKVFLNIRPQNIFTFGPAAY